MPAGHRVDYTVEDRIAYIALNTPPGNATAHAMIDAIRAGLRRADADAGVGIVLVTGALPGMFCGGMDLRMMLAGNTQTRREFVYRFYLATLNIQYALRKPTVAAMSGPARRAGVTRAISCDRILAANDVDVGYLEIDSDLIQAIHYVHLPRQIGRHKAFQLLFEGKPIPAPEAAAPGIVNDAVPPDELLPRANDLDYRRDVENQIETLCNVFETADAREDLAAFLEKRPPHWQRDG